MSDMKGMVTQVWLPKHVSQQMQQDYHRAFPLETGGILLGYRAVANGVESWVITAASNAGPKATHRHTTYTPDYRHDKRIARDHYQDTAGQEYYIGDWHTHPAGSPATSRQDRWALRSIAGRADHLSNRGLMLIMGVEGANRALLCKAHTMTRLPFWRGVGRVQTHHVTLY